MIKWLKSLFTKAPKLPENDWLDEASQYLDKYSGRKSAEAKLKKAVEEGLEERGLSKETGKAIMELGEAANSVAKLTELEQSFAKKVTAVDVSHLTDEEMEELVEKLNAHSDHLEELLAESGNKTDEQNLADITEASKELEKLLGVKFDSLEDFMAKSSQSQVVPFTEIENFNDAFKELDHFHQSAEIKSDWDILEELISYHNKGYEFAGLMDIYKKMEKKDDLTDGERKQMKDWYVLVGTELVYNV